MGIFSKLNKKGKILDGLSILLLRVKLSANLCISGVSRYRQNIYLQRKKYRKCIVLRDLIKVLN